MDENSVSILDSINAFLGGRKCVELFIENKNYSGTNGSDSNTDLPKSIIKDPVSASALLDSVALFELQGSKWMLAIPFEKWNHEIHEHCFDEVGHTKLVQDTARNLRSTFSNEELIEEASLNLKYYKITERYLNQLSKYIYKLSLSHTKKDKNFSLSAYTVMAFLIERRIMKIYPAISIYSESEFVKKMAKKIIKDERKHLGFVNDKMENYLISWGLTQKDVIKKEDSLAKIWIKELTHAKVKY